MMHIIVYDSIKVNLVSRGSYIEISNLVHRSSNVDILLLRFLKENWTKKPNPYLGYMISNDGRMMYVLAESCNTVQIIMCPSLWKHLHVNFKNFSLYSDYYPSDKDIDIYIIPKN